MSLKSFLRESAKQPENIKVIISRRFLDENGEPERWELKAITDDEHSKIKDACTVKSIFKGRQTSTFNSPRYTRLLAAASVVYPDLNDAELQKSYGVIGADEVLGKMLIAGEMTELQRIVQELDGFDLEESMTEVKNS